MFDWVDLATCLVINSAMLCFPVQFCQTQRFAGTACSNQSFNKQSVWMALLAPTRDCQRFPWPLLSLSQTQVEENRTTETQVPIETESAD